MKIASIEHDKTAAHTLTLEEFKVLKDKGHPVIKKKRAAGKVTGLAMEFGEGPFKFGTYQLKMEWDADERDDYIAVNDLEDSVADILRRMRGRIDPGDARYVACAEKIVNEYFDAFRGLRRWQEAQVAFAEEHGYVRSPFGARRLFPQLRYQGKDSNGGAMKSLKNTACNSPVQNHEVVIVNRALVATEAYVEEHRLRSSCIGNIHDAIPSYVHRDEATEFIGFMHRQFSVDYPENGGVTFGGETDIADLQKGEVWGFGEQTADSDNEDYEYAEEAS